MKFTDRKILNLKPGPQRYIEWESNGLGIRVSPHGRKSWVFMYRFNNKPRMMTLGTYPMMTVARAHEAHGKALSDLDQDIDPGANRVKENADSRSAPTVKDLKDEYIRKWAKKHKRSWAEDDRMLEKDVIPTWGNRRARDILRRDVIKLLDGIVDRGSPIVANRILEIIRKMFNFGIEQDITQGNPCALVRAPGKKTQRDRVLTPDEIKTFWNNLDKANMTMGTRIALKLLLVTAQRRAEVATIEIKELDLNTGWWTIPAEKTKNGLSHRVPLSATALKLVKQAIELAGDSTYLFPSPRMNKKTTPPSFKPITPSSLSKTIKRNQTDIGVSNFTPHDLRRTAASLMTGMGVDRLVVKKLLNHADRDITAVYDRHSYDPEKQKALNTWGRELETIIKGKKENKVVKLGAAS